MTNGNVLGFLAVPDREDSLRAISLALLKVRALDGMTCPKLGKLLDCCPDTIAKASNEESLLSFDSVARLCYLFPDESKPVRDLWERAEDAPTVAERLARIERELDAIRRESA